MNTLFDRIYAELKKQVRDCPELKPGAPNPEHEWFWCDNQSVQKMIDSNRPQFAFQLSNGVLFFVSKNNPYDLYHMVKIIPHWQEVSPMPAHDDGMTYDELVTRLVSDIEKYRPDSMIAKIQNRLIKMLQILNSDQEVDLGVWDWITQESVKLFGVGEPDHKSSENLFVALENGHADVDWQDNGVPIVYQNFWNDEYVFKSTGRNKQEFTLNCFNYMGRLPEEFGLDTQLIIDEGY